MGKITVEVKINTFGTMTHPNTPETDVRFVCTILLISHLNTKDVHVESE